MSKPNQLLNWKEYKRNVRFILFLHFSRPGHGLLPFPSSASPLHTHAVLLVRLHSLSRNWTHSSCCRFDSQNSRLVLLEAVKKTKAQKKWQSQLCSVVETLGVCYSRSQLGFHFCIVMPVVVHQPLGYLKRLWVASWQPIDPRGRQLIFHYWETLWIPEGPWT